MFGYITKDGAIKLFEYASPMDADIYCNLLQERVIPSIRELYGNNFVLQQDGAAVHTAKTTTEMLKLEEIEILCWPSRSPDLNPIENVWAWMQYIIYSGPPVTQLRDLRKRIHDAAEQISVEKIVHLCTTFEGRMEKLVKARGDKIKM